MEDFYTFENNLSSFEDSIINTLNLDKEIIENRINEELFDTYINKHLKQKLLNSNQEDIIFNPIIVKLSKVKNIFDKYASSITKLSHKEYINVIKEKINLKITTGYIKNNIEVDYDNEIECFILSTHASNILKRKLKNIEDQKWFVNYIININAKKQNMSFKVIGITCKNIKKCKLIKNNNFKYIKNLNNIYSDDYIYINLGMFSIINKTKNFESALLYLINSCLTELQKQIQKNKEYSMIYNDNIYRFIKENIIYHEDSTYYDKNKEYFDKHIDLKDETNKMLSELVDNPLFKDFDLINDINIENTDFIKNTKDYNLIDDYIDSILIKKPSILKDNILLQMEYNMDGTRKSVKELIKVKQEKLKVFEDQITTFKELLKESPNENYKKDILYKLNTIENGILGINRCHNKMIYKSLKHINVSHVEKLCSNLTDEEIKILKEAVLQEKNDFINKLESNRKKIFKPTTFLKNEQFLTREYSKSAIYESKLRDIQKEKEN